MNGSRPRVFISHAAEDADFARPIAAWLKNCLLDSVDCFVSSDASIPIGSNWLNEVGAALRDSAVFLILVSRASISRRWIYFEAGAGCVRDIPVVPVCIAGMTVAELESPLSALEALALPGVQAERRLLELVAKPAGVVPRRKFPRLELPSRADSAAHGRSSGGTPAAMQRVYKNTTDHNFRVFFEALLSAAKDVILVGTGLNILYHDGPLRLFDSNTECQWQVYVANPYSLEVQTRLVEEETVVSPKPTIRKEGLLSRLESLLERQKHRPNISVKLFSHYPTLSFFVIDKRHYFFYPYGFARLGDYSPVVYACAENPEDAPLVDFFNDQCRLTEQAAVDATLVHDIQASTSSTTERHQRLKSALIPFAVYFVPHEDAPLYEFGSACLGFDIRRQQSTESSWPVKYTRNGSPFGFHMTLADALYFVEPSVIDTLATELRSLAHEFSHADIAYELTPQFPDGSSISLVCHDSTGKLEALHHELVFRCYRRAIASNYSAFFRDKRAHANRNYAMDPDRARLMIDRYHAPYILNAFKPHFSLLSNIEPERMKAVQQRLNDDLPPPPVVLSSICLLTRESDDRPWKLFAEYPLRP